jgi:hypothetical protein
MRASLIRASYKKQQIGFSAFERRSLATLK